MSEPTRISRAAWIPLGQAPAELGQALGGGRGLAGRRRVVAAAGAAGHQGGRQQQCQHRRGRPSGAAPPSPTACPPLHHPPRCDSFATRRHEAYYGPHLLRVDRPVVPMKAGSMLGNLSLRPKIALILLLPVAALLLLAGLRIGSSVSTSRQAAQVRGLTEFALRGTALAHELQGERGLTLGRPARRPVPGPAARAADRHQPRPGRLPRQRRRAGRRRARPGHRREADLGHQPAGRAGRPAPGRQPGVGQPRGRPRLLQHHHRRPAQHQPRAGLRHRRPAARPAGGGVRGPVPDQGAGRPGAGAGLGGAGPRAVRARRVPALHLDPGHPGGAALGVPGRRRRRPAGPVRRHPGRSRGPAGPGAPGGGHRRRGRAPARGRPGRVVDGQLDRDRACCAGSRRAWARPRSTPPGPTRRPPASGPGSTPSPSCSSWPWPSGCPWSSSGPCCGPSGCCGRRPRRSPTTSSPAWSSGSTGPSRST